MGKVSDIRGKYYLRLSEATKREIESKESLERKAELNKSRYECYLTYKKMFQNICKSAHIKWRLNYKVARWVFLFIDKLKEKCNKVSKRGRGKLIQRLTAVTSEKEIRMRRIHPSAKLIKQDYHRKNEYDRSTDINPEKIKQATKEAKKFNLIVCK